MPSFNHCIPAHLKCPLLIITEYLDNIAIRHPELGGNDAVHNFDILKRSVLLGPSTLPMFRKYSYSSLFLFYTVYHNKNILQ